MFLRVPVVFILLLAVLPTGSVAQLSAREELELMTNRQKADTAEIIHMLNVTVHIGKTERDSAQTLLNEIYRLSYQSGFSWGIAKSLQQSGIIYAHGGKYDRGIDRLKQQIYYCVTTGKHTDMLGVGYNMLGNIYQAQGKYREAAYCYHHMLRLPKEHVKQSTIALIYINLARLTHKLKQPEKALYYLERAETLSGDNNYYDLLCTVNSHRGMIYTEIGQPDSAIYYLRKSLYLVNEYNPRYQGELLDIAYASMTYLTDLWLQEGSLDSARECVRKLQEIKTFVVPQYRNKAHLTIGKFYMQSADYKRAEQYLLMALDSIQIIHADNDLANVYLALSSLYDASGKHKLALQYNRYYIRLKDSLESEEVASNVHQLEVRYRTAEKERELITRQHDVREKNLWIAIIASGMIVLTIISIALYKKHQADRRLQQKEIQLLRREQQSMQQEQDIKQLKAMMKGEEQERGRLARELHDGIGGMLTAIKLNLITARRKNPELSGYPSLKEVIRMLEDTGAEVRKTAHNLMPDVLVRHSLPEALMIFCEHIHEQLPTDLSCKGDLSQLDKATELMLYRMTQELIQNILKHASATQAAIQLYLYDGKLSLTVEDNGTGFDTEQAHHGFGLENLRYRIAALQGKISITSDRHNSTIVHLEFELKKLLQINNPQPEK